MDNNVDVPEVRSGNGNDQDIHRLKYIEPIVLEKTPKERIEWLWGKLRTQHDVFDDTTRNDGRQFVLNLFLPGTEHFFIADKGYAMASGIMPRTSCVLHFAVWDSPEPSMVFAALRELISYMFERYELNRVTAAVPVYNKSVLRLAVLLGFRFEGQFRQSILHEGKYHDVALYGLLRSEFSQREVAH